MIANTTYYEKNINDKIKHLVGKPYSPIDLIKIGTVGSSRMIIKAYSPTFKKFIEQSNDLTYASISLRPKGIVITLSKSYKNLSWAIPYHYLSIYKTDVLSIHAEGEFLKLKLKKKQNKKLIEKMLAYKIKYLNP